MDIKYAQSQKCALFVNISSFCLDSSVCLCLFVFLKKLFDQGKSLSIATSCVQEIYSEMR